MDLPDTKERFTELKNAIPDQEILGISLYNEWGLEEVKKAFIRLADEMQKIKPQKESLDPYSQNKNFMTAELDDVSYEEKNDDEHFGATVSLSRKRKPKKWGLQS